MEKYIAHVRESDGVWSIQSLRDHLKNVADIASDFAKHFSNDDWGYAVGLLHDIGKSSKKWQEYISQRSGYLDSPDRENSSCKVTHSTHGAVWAINNWPHVGKVMAYLIAGHHGGLPDWFHEMGVGGGLAHRLKKEETEKLPEIAVDIADYVNHNLIIPKSLPCGSQLESEQIHLWIRMLYSCLVDADFLDTEEFMNPENRDWRGGYLSLDKLSGQFDIHMASLKKASKFSLVNVIREDILKQCRIASGKTPGLFSLTVPTGGGKTLSSMAFALDHALEHRKDRIIMVIPYTSIIEQTAKIYKEIFGEVNVLEHHSSLDPTEETQRSRLASENWDAPIIVTTSVRFFESLFSAKPSTCRRLHNIVNSIVILDEAQMLPTNYLKPILYSIKGLISFFKVTMVLCTATQPAIGDKIFRKGNGEYYSLLDDIPCREIMVKPTPLELTGKLQRVMIEPLEKPISDWSELTEKLTDYPSVLCVVNTRKDCRELFELMPEGTLHLSANMCGEHRSETIELIKKQLKKNESVRVISTQLVEAGVDFDFPVVFRAMAGFDSIAQAAGRCNREGLLPEKGKVFVFEPPNQPPVGNLRKGAQTGREILAVDPEGCRNLLPDTVKRYFQLYYSGLHTFDSKEIVDLLSSNVHPDLNIQFRTAAERFRMIDDQYQQSVVIWYEGERANSFDLIEELRKFGPRRELMRKLQRFTITLPKYVFEKVQDSFELIHDVWCQYADSAYDNVLGFVDDTSSVI